MHQCITWDGVTLACLDLAKPGETETVLYHINQPMPHVSFPNSQLGVVQALILHAVNPTVMSGVKDLLETLPLDEFMRFYYQAARHGLLGKDFEFMMMAVLDKTVLAMHARGRRANMFQYVAREKAVAVGEYATAATLLMDAGIRAQAACGAAQLDFFNDEEAIFDTSRYVTYSLSEDPQQSRWEYHRDNRDRCSFYTLPCQRAPMMPDFYTRLNNGETVL